MSSVPASAPTLAPGQHVIVRNVHVGMLPATIEKADAATVTVALAVKDERIAAPGRARDRGRDHLRPRDPPLQRDALRASAPAR